MNKDLLCFSRTATAAACLMTAVSVSAITPAQQPLQLGGQVEPNVMFLMDNSLSMRWGYMPDELKAKASLDDCPYWWDVCSESDNRFLMSSTLNSVYYDPDPDINYDPPRKSDGTRYPDAHYTGAYLDGYLQQGESVNLSVDYRAIMDDGNFVIGEAGQARYYVFNANCSDPYDNSCYSQKLIQTSFEQQKFANWFSYYRTRMLAAKSGVSEAFYPQNANIRVGYGAINKGTATVDNSSTSTIVSGVRPFSGSSKIDFFNWIKTLQAGNFTPLRKALGDAGEYYSRTDDHGPWSTTPGAAGGTEYSCRQSYTILTTDGYWNRDAASRAQARADVDNDGVANTLADVAKYYWNTDLNASLDDNVPTSELNKQKQQHMVTFGVGLGLAGVVKPTPEQAFDAVKNGNESALQWPDPKPSSSNPSDEANKARLIDLLHASANGRGAFFNAQNPVEFADALASSLVSIVNLATSNTPGASSSARITDGSLVYQASYDSENWTGKLIASRPVETGAGLELTAKWEAGSLIDSSKRSLFTSNTSGYGKGVEMSWASVNQASFNNDEGLFNYIRGSRSDEAPSGRDFRKRDSLLGDIVNSSIKVVNRQDFGYTPTRTGIAGYPEFITQKRARPPVVYAGANDGFLHAFHGENGTELFAYMPFGLGNVSILANEDYGHRYFVDGPLHEHDVFISTPASAKVAAWRTVLLGGLGAGGKSVFALDVTDVTDASAFNAKNILWEFTDADMGHSYSEPVVGRLSSGKWVAIFGNGFGLKPDDTLLDSVLYIVDLETGQPLQKLTLAENTGGMATPGYVYAPPEGKKSIHIQQVFVGDYAGNLWRLDTNNSGDFSSAFGTAKKPNPLFQATADGVTQPITTRPVMSRHPSQTDTYLVHFGTGSYMTYADITAPALTQVQSIYGIWSEGRPSGGGSSTPGPTSKQYLEQVKIHAEENNAKASGIDSRTIEEKLEPIDWNSKSGWYIDLLSQGTDAEGERVVQPAEILTGVLLVKTRIPSEDPCAHLDEGWLMALDLASGSRVDRPVLDFDGDGKINAGDEFSDKSEDGIEQRSGIRGDFIPITGLLIGDEKCYYYGLTIDCGQRPTQKRISWEQIDEK